MTFFQQPARWFVPRGRALKWREWDGDFVVFDPESGDTHFLNAVAGTVLQFFESRPATMADVEAHLENVSGKPVDEELAEHLRGLVANFDAVGLIEPVRP